MSAVEPSGDIVAAIRADPILAPDAEALLHFARSSIRLRVDRTAVRSVGESRVGGRPGVPPGFAWPSRDVGLPAPDPQIPIIRFVDGGFPGPDRTSGYQFIAQIELGAVAPFDLDGLLPNDGHLLFFYEEREHSWDQVDQVRIIHVPGGQRLTLSDDGPSAPSALALAASQEWTVPSTDAYVIASAATPDDERQGRLAISPEAAHRLAEIEYRHRLTVDIDQMLGWADNGAHGPSLPPEVIRGWASIPPGDRMRETQDARLLLQLSPATYEPTGIRFGRTLYFYVRESDLRRGDFSRAWYDSD
jgi:hypothetical protein